MSLAVQKDTLILCPGCSERIGIITRDVETHEVALSDQIKFQPGQECGNGDLMNCKRCGVSYFRNASGQIYTSEGWRP